MSAKSKMMIQTMYNDKNPHHQSHIKEFCDYADETAAEA